MRKVWVKATMAEMIHWTFNRALQILLWNVKVRWMAQLFLVRSQGGYHHALLLIVQLHMLEHSLVKHGPRLLTALVSGVSSPFAQSLQD